MMKKNLLSYQSGVAERPLIYETIGGYFESIVQRYPENEALVVCHQNIRWTYAEYNEKINALAAGLLKLGIEPGDRVGIWAPNCVEWCLTQVATAKIGAVLVCINPAYRVYELEYVLNKSGCRALITAEFFKTSDYLGMLLELAPEIKTHSGRLQSKTLPNLEMVISMGSNTDQGFLSFSDICNSGSELDYQALRTVSGSLQPDDVINIQFTSGTTGNPKGATLTHFNILNNADQSAQQMQFSPRDRLCIPVPLYHCFGLVLGTLVCIARGATAVFPADYFDAKTTIETISNERCTALHGVPTMFIAELELKNLSEYDLTSLRTGIMAGAPCPIEVMRRVISEMHMAEVLIAYGQTETSPISHFTAANDSLIKRVSTIGRVAPYLEVKIINDNGDVLPFGEKGEICCRGYAVMHGYWQDQEKTAETIDSAGWLHSGDLAIMDEDGYVDIVGRKKDMIIRGGENISPREIEEFLYTHEAIQEVQVFGIANEKYGEEVCAWIQLKEDQSITELDLKIFCKGKIAHFKIPTYIKFVDSYPMTVTGKIQKFKMREIMLADIQV